MKPDLPDPRGGTWVDNRRGDLGPGHDDRAFDATRVQSIDPSSH
jgi:hypothetical protein